MSAGASADDNFEQVAVSKNLSQLIRSNTVHYWTAMKSEIDLGSLGPYLGYEGMLAGDPHAGNFAVLPLETVKGSRKMRFANVDFDDAGRGPFVLDLIRYMIASKASDQEMKRRVQEKAYLKGLGGKEISPPKEVSALLRIGVPAYDQMVTDYATRKSSAKGFIIKQGKIEAYTAKIAPRIIEDLFPSEKVVDLAIRPEARGGSSGGLRIWILVENKSARRRIVELKQYEDPATAKYQVQAAPGKRLKEIRKAFWPGLNGSDYDLITLPGAGLFWIREKRVSLIDLPYSSTKKKKLRFLDELEVYDANQLGLAHGRQASAMRYRAAIKKDPEAFHRATEPVERAYLDLARKVFTAEHPSATSATARGTSTEAAE